MPLTRIARVVVVVVKIFTDEQDEKYSEKKASGFFEFFS